MSALQTTGGNLPATRSQVPAPISMLHPDLQKSVRWFCSFYFETLKGTAAIASRFRWWMQEDGLTLDEAKEAMRSLMRPEKAAEIDTAPKVVAVLSGEVARILRDRRERERAAKLTKTGPPSSEADLERMKLLLASAWKAGEA